jgi:hypothetical protein
MVSSWGVRRRRALTILWGSRGEDWKTGPRLSEEASHASANEPLASTNLASFAGRRETTSYDY